MCGILGIVGTSDVAAQLYDGLTVLQHRGQDAGQQGEEVPAAQAQTAAQGVQRCPSFKDQQVLGEGQLGHDQEARHDQQRKAQHHQP